MSPRGGLPEGSVSLRVQVGTRKADKTGMGMGRTTWVRVVHNVIVVFAVLAVLPPTQVNGHGTVQFAAAHVTANPGPPAGAESRTEK